MARLVLALQFWAGDRDLAMKLARRIADNELTPRSDVEFCFVARFDTVPDHATVQHVAKKFRTSTHIGQRRGTGWPYGCNDLWCDLAQEMHRRSHNAWRDVKAVLTFEADCVPVDPDWIDKLLAEWDKASALGKSVVGCWMNNCTPFGHINGNALFAPDIARKCPIVVGCPADYAWDVAFAGAFQPIWYKTGLLANFYRDLNVRPDQIRTIYMGDQPPVMIHGVKDDSVWRYAETVLRGGATPPAPLEPATIRAPEKVVEVIAMPAACAPRGNCGNLLD